MQKQKNLPGFTLVEILVVVALIAILATLTIVALNPAKNFADTRDTQRSSHVNTILNGISQYISQANTSLDDFQMDSDGAGTLVDIPTCPAVGNIAIGLANDANSVDIATKLVDDYLVEIPQDPQNESTEVTGYTICQTNGRVQIEAPDAENAVDAGGDSTIIVKR